MWVDFSYPGTNKHAAKVDVNLSLISRPSGRAVADGESVPATLTIDDEQITGGAFTELMPNGARFYSVSLSTSLLIRIGAANGKVTVSVNDLTDIPIDSTDRNISASSRQNCSRLNRQELACLRRPRLAAGSHLNHFLRP
jgi:hypothetical protein